MYEAYLSKKGKGICRRIERGRGRGEGRPGKHQGGITGRGVERIEEDFKEIFKQFKNAVLERALGAELTQYLGYGKGEDKPERCGNGNGNNPAEMRKIIYITNAIGSLHMQLRKTINKSFDARIVVGKLTPISR